MSTGFPFQRQGYVSIVNQDGIVAEPYSLSQLFNLTVLGEHLVANIQLLQDSEFSMQDILALFSTGAPGCHIQITDTSSGKTLFNNPIPGQALLSNVAGWPFQLPVPYVFRANGSIKIDIYNDVNGVNNVEIVFHGIRLYKG